MKGAAAGIVGDLARARIALDERGQKLSEVEERTAAMMASADSFSKHAHEVPFYFVWNFYATWMFCNSYSHYFLFPVDDAEV